MMSAKQSVKLGWQGKPKYSGENLPQCHFVLHKSHLPWARTRASALGSQRLTAWALARPYLKLKIMPNSELQNTWSVSFKLCYTVIACMIPNVGNMCSLFIMRNILCGIVLLYWMNAKCLVWNCTSLLNGCRSPYLWVHIVIEITKLIYQPNHFKHELYILVNN
jgi:hypothetical protein